MNRRPLCLVCLCFMISIWILENVGITYGGNPLKYQEFEKCVQNHSNCEARGEIFRYEIRADGTSYLYLTSAILTVSVKQFSNHTIRIKLEEPYDLSIGNEVRVKGSLYEMPCDTNPGQFDSDFYYRIQGITGFVKGEDLQILDGRCDPIRNGLWKLRERAKRLLKLLSPKESGVLSAMLLGDKTLLKEETRDYYRLIGILHILAVSGTHLAVLSRALYSVLMRAGCGRRFSGNVAVCLMILYGVFTGNSISVIRSVTMFGLSVGAELVGRTYDMLSALALSAILLLVEYPGYLFDSGFLLSFGAALGLAFLMPAMGEKWKVLKGGAAVCLIQLPVLQYYFYEVPVCSLLINLMVIPLVPVVLVCGMAGLSAGIFSLETGRLLLVPARLILGFYEEMGKIAAKIPGIIWITGRPSLWQIAAYLLLLSAAVWKGRRLKGRGFAAAALLAAAILSFRVPDSFSLTMLDVGQGDALVLHTPSGHHYLIDGGSSSVEEVGKYRILPYLKSQGIAALKGVFVTHGDEDHISGILEILDDMKKGMTSLRIGRLYLPRWMEGKEDQSLQQAAKAAGVKVVYLERGDQICDGEVMVDVLHPDHGAYLEDENSGSLTLKVGYGSFTALLTGDLCGDGETAVAKQDVASDLLKVAHHGSSSSTADMFLQKVKPQIALISCGKNNRYGHPSEEVLQRLENAQVRIFDTRECGAVTVKVDGEKILVREFAG